MSIEIIQPEIFKNIKGVSAIFTLANREKNFGSDSKKGLNLGLKTTESFSEFSSNLSQLSKQTGTSLDEIALAEQVHKNSIEIVDKPGIYKETDGFITSTAGLALGIQVADCAAILIADPVNRIVGAFHAGWRGAVAEIVPIGIDLMINQGALADQMYVYVSACISLVNFEVGPEVADKFPDKYCDHKSYRKAHVDLSGFIKEQIIGKGVPEKNIEVSGNCTIEDDRYFSFRRERDDAGRMLAVIKLT